MKAEHRASFDERLIPTSAGEHEALGACGRVVIAVWRRETRVESVRALESLLEQRALIHLGGVGLLQIIEDDALPPSVQARLALAKMHGNQAHHIRRSALVYSKPGFGAAAARAVITGVAMLNPPRFAHELFSDLRKAIHWLDDELAPARTHAQATSGLENAVAELRRLSRFACAPASSVRRAPAL